MIAMPSIYMLTSPSGKSYIGQTKNCPRLRLKQHTQAWRRWSRDGRERRGSQAKLYYAFDAHDPSKWTLTILYESTDASTLNEAERRLIVEHDTVESGYNVMAGGGGWAKGQLSEEHRRRQSEARKAWYQTEDGIAWRKKLAERKEHLSKMGTIAGKNSAGRTRSEEARRKTSETLKNKWSNEWNHLREERAEQARVIGLSNRRA